MAIFNTLAMGRTFEPFKMLDCFAHRKSEQSEQSSALPVGDHAGDTASGADAPFFAGVIGAKGGVGASTLAFNLAAALHEILPDVTLVDADVQQPALSVLSAHEPNYTISDLL